VAAVAGGLIGGVATYASAQNQIVAEDARARTDFLREQRQAAYADLLTAHQGVLDYMSTNRAPAEDEVGGGKPSPARSEYVTLLLSSAESTEYLNAISQVQLVGSTQCRQPVASLWSKMTQFALSDGVERVSRWGTLATNDWTLAFDEFLACASEDIGS
jgi:hypothetical protein